MKWLDCQKVKFNQQLVVKLIHFVKKNEGKTKQTSSHPGQSVQNNKKQ